MNVTDYKLPNGYILADEEIEQRVEMWENETWDGSLATIRSGRPRLSDEPNANLSFKCPASSAQLIERAALASGVKKSAFMRNAAIEKAVRILSTAR